MYHFDNKENLGLNFERNSVINDFKHAFITKSIIDLHTLSHYGNYAAPLYIWVSFRNS